ncbi:hypothetical protein AB0G02_21065, partial [Actinosynnema sp. NPDC023658]
ADHSPPPARPAAPPPAHPGPADRTSTTAPGEEKRGDRKALVALAIVALIAVAVVVYLLNRDGDGGSPSANGPTTTSATAAPTTSGAANENPPAGTTQEQPAATTTTAAPPQTTEPSPDPGTVQPPAEVGPDQALSAYYGLLPSDLDTAYARLTDGFKATRAQTFGDYQAFWGQMSAVNVSDVRSVGPDQVAATVSYTYKSGATAVEQHVYSMVKVGGQWMIDAQNGA